MFARAVVVLAVAAAVAGCGGSDQPAATPTKTPSPPAPTQTEAPPAPAPTVSGANAYIVSIAVDPGGGTVVLGTGLGLFRLEQGTKDARRVTGELATPNGTGQVSSNLVAYYAGPGDLLASGHPEGGGLPENLGLMRSKDAGNTWAPVAEIGESDYHILQAAGQHAVGVRADDAKVRVSDDGGRTFEERTPPDTPLDLAFDPADPKRMVVTTQQGLYSSGDGGGSWRLRDTTPAATELAIDAGGALYASVAGGEVRRSTDGGAHWSRLVKLK